MSRAVNFSFLAGGVAESPVRRMLVSVPSAVVSRLSQLLSSVLNCSSTTSINSIRPSFNALMSPSLNLDNVTLLKQGSSSDPINKRCAECNDCNSNLCDICNPTVSLKSLIIFKSEPSVAESFSSFSSNPCKIANTDEMETFSS